jgi:drug/metabolite transporter (DMT)-like permease
MLAAVAAIWGSSYLLIKYALEGFSPAEVVFLRSALAAATLLPLCWLRGGATRTALREGSRRPIGILGVGLLFVAAPFLLISYGEKVVPVGLTAILISPAPIFVAAFAPLIDDDERLGGAQWLGLGAGLAGIAVLVGVESIGSLEQFLGALAMIGAAACYAAAGYMVKLRFADQPSMVTSAFAVTAGAVITLPLAIVTAAHGAPSTRAVLVTLLLGPVNTGLAFVIFYALIAEVGAGRAALVAYLTPPFSLALGIVFRDESITVAVVVGLALILGGVALASRAPARVSRVRSASPPPEPSPGRPSGPDPRPAASSCPRA